MIDCRGAKCFRSYYTKWHELAHLLILTDQMRLTFRRTHFGLDEEDPEEALVDVIAGAFGFYPDLIRPEAKGPISFERIEDIRARLCPEASCQSSVIGVVKAWSSPCLLIQAELALKRGEKRAMAQRAFEFREEPTPVLRAVQVSPNEFARSQGLTIYPNMRVPECSVIHEVFSRGLTSASARESLADWESSDGTRLPDARVLVQARKNWDGVQALITPG